jgi:hypothetical protein
MALLQAVVPLHVGPDPLIKNEKIKLATCISELPPNSSPGCCQALRTSTGAPMREPLLAASLKPFSQAAWNSGGMLLPAQSRAQQDTARYHRHSPFAHFRQSPHLQARQRPPQLTHQSSTQFSMAARHLGACRVSAWCPAWLGNNQYAHTCACIRADCLLGAR